jgi:hypothetical protein
VGLMLDPQSTLVLRVLFSNAFIYTLGIYLWGEPIIDEDSNTAILLIDTEVRKVVLFGNLRASDLYNKMKIMIPKYLALLYSYLLILSIILCRF